MSADSRRIAGADGIRAIACLWVMVHHIAIACELDTPGPWRIIRHEGGLGVSIFFVLSGMLLSRPFWEAALGKVRLPDLRAYTWARMVRIVPAYYVCLLVSFLLFADASADPLSRLLASLTFINWSHWRTFYPTPVNAPLWSIGVEVCFYAMLPLWALGLKRVKSLRSGLAYVAISLAAIVLLMKASSAFTYGESPAVTLSDPLQADAHSLLPAKNPLSLFSHFLFGCAASAVLVNLAHRAESHTSRRFNRFDALALACLALAAIEIYPALIPIPAFGQFLNRAQVWFLFYRWPIFPAVIAGLLIALHRSAVVSSLFDNRFLRWTAKLSYGIYLWHEVVIGLLEPIWPTSAEGFTLSTLTFAIVVSALAYVASAISFRLIEQPAIDWLKGRRSRSSAVAIATPAVASAG